MSKDLIRCDNCGKFISHSQLNSGGGASGCFIPDSEISVEEIGYRCKDCTSKFGKIRPKQFGDIEMNSWIY